MARPRTLAQLLNDIANNPGVYFPALGKGSAGRTAQAATYLNYSPQFDTLRALLGQSDETLRTGVQSARRTGLAGSQGIQHIRDTYTRGLADTLGNVGGAVTPNAVTHNPDARAAQELGLSGQAVAGMLSQMAGQQVAGIANQAGQLRRQHASDLSSIAGKTGSLLGQAGAYNTQQYEGLASANRKERAAAIKAEQDRRTRLITAGINPDTGQYDPSLKPPAKPAAPHLPVDGIDYETWLSMTPAQRQKAHREWAQAGRTGDTQGLTPAQRNARIEKYAQLRDDIGSIGDFYKRASGFKIHYNPDTGAVVKADGDGNYPDGTATRPAKPGEIAAAVTKQFPHASPLLIKAANEKAHGFLTSGTIAALKKRYPGLQIPHDWHPPAGYGVTAPKNKDKSGPFW